MCEISDLFADRGLRCTRARLEVYRSLASTKCHPTAERLHEEVTRAIPGTSLATVYNTLEALCCAGLCRKLPTCCGPTRYDADIGQHIHVTTQDGRVIDVPEDLGRKVLENLQADAIERIEEALGVHIAHVSVNLVAGGCAPIDD